MKHIGTKTLETNRLVLRKFSQEDASYMFKNWANDDEVTKYLSWKIHSNIDVSLDIIKTWESQYDNEDFYNWAIVLKEINEVIGSIGVVKVKDEINAVEIGYCIGKKWWNQKIVSEALMELIRFFFEEVGVNRIESNHDISNANSGKVMLKCGLRLEGVSKEGGINNQGIHDKVNYGLIAKDYFNK